MLSKSNVISIVLKFIFIKYFYMFNISNIGLSPKQNKIFLLQITKLTSSKI